LTEAKKEFVGSTLNFRVRMLLKDAVIPAGWLQNCFTTVQSPNTEMIKTNPPKENTPESLLSQ